MILFRSLNVGMAKLLIWRMEFQRPNSEKWEVWSTSEHLTSHTQLDKQWFEKHFPGFTFRIVKYELKPVFEETLFQEKDQ